MEAAPDFKLSDGAGPESRSAASSPLGKRAGSSAGSSPLGRREGGSPMGGRAGTPVSTTSLQMALRDYLEASKRTATEVFKQWDTDGSGDIDANEFQVAMDALGFSANEDEVEALFNLLDSNESGSFVYANLSELLNLSPQPKTKTKDEVWQDSLQRSILLKHLAKPELKYVKQSLKSMSHSVGQVVYNAGDVADTAYFVQSGTYIATRPSPAGPRKLREYGPGDSFGSCELLAGELRCCNVSCIETGQVWLVNKRVFMEKMRVAAPPKKELLEHVRAVPLFADAEMQAAQLTQLCRAAVEMKYTEGDTICRNDEAARHIYALIAGDAVAVHAKGEFTMKPLCSFGESSLYAKDELRTRNAGVRAGPTGATVLAFDVAHIEALVGFTLHEKAVHSYNRKMLQSVQLGGSPITEGLSEADLIWLVEALVEESYTGGSVVADAGSEDEKLQIIKRGTASVMANKKASDSDSDIVQLEAGDYFGELSLIKRRTRKTTVAANDPVLLTVSLSSDLVRGNTALNAWREALFKKEAGTTDSGKKKAKDGKEGAEDVVKSKEGKEARPQTERGSTERGAKSRRGTMRRSYAEGLIADKQEARELDAKAAAKEAREAKKEEAKDIGAAGSSGSSKAVHPKSQRSQRPALPAVRGTSLKRGESPISQRAKGSTTPSGKVSQRGSKMNKNPAAEPSSSRPASSVPTSPESEVGSPSVPESAASLPVAALDVN